MQAPIISSCKPPEKQGGILPAWHVKRNCSPKDLGLDVLYVCAGMEGDSESKPFQTSRVSKFLPCKAGNNIMRIA
jgi:hypothetical protein